MHRNCLAAISKIVRPRFFHEAVQEPKWRKAMTNEIKALEKSNTWSVETLPLGKKPINYKWVFKVKYKSDGSVERYKAQLVIQGDEQIKGFYYNETFAPIAKMTSVRTFLVVAAAKGWELHQIDVNNAFLHGDLDKEVYMRMPPSFRTPSKQGMSITEIPLWLKAGTSVMVRQAFFKTAGVWFYPFICRLFVFHL